MNRQQRRAMAKKQPSKQGNESDVFIYAYGLIVKILREQWGWGAIRLNRLTNQLTDEVNNNQMTVEELQQWCLENAGFKLPIGSNVK